MYIYRNTEKRKDKWAKQVVFRIAGGDERGSLLGVVGFVDGVVEGVSAEGGDGVEKEEKRQDVKILCLCEKGLKVMKGLNL